MVDYKLQRFLDAQQGVYNQALAESEKWEKIFSLDLVHISSVKRIGDEL